MKITVARHAGFCSGVKAAVDKALELAEKYGHIYTLGELVHNELVTDFLRSNHVDSIDLSETDRLKSGDVVLIRAHGVPVEVEEALREKGLIVEDATCPVVKRNQDIASREAQKGNYILIVGDEKHDEVIALKSRAGEFSKVVTDVQESDCDSERTSVLFQTTVLQEKFDKIADFINKFEKNRHKSFDIFNTICYNTKVRQDEVRSLARSSDAVLVLGSPSSANTRRLAEVAREVNPNVFFASSVREVESCKNLFKDFDSVSVAAGASTPPWLIREVNKLMSETQNIAENTAEVEAKKEATLQEQPVTENESMSMDDLMKSASTAGKYVSYKVGKRIKGTVIIADDKGVYVAIGGKKDGFIDKSEACLDGNYNPSDFKQGDEIQAIITDANNKEYVALSKKAVDQVRVEEEMAEAALASGEFSVVMTEVVKNGLRGKLGPYTVFVPASQIKIGYVKNLEDYKGKTLRLTYAPPKATEKVADAAEAEATEAVAEGEVKEEKRQRKYSITASQRVILEREKKEKEDRFWGSMHVNDIVTGKVKRFTQFGAFVSVDGFDCLAHISELSWNRINDPSKILKIGETKDFVVLKLDRENNRVSLGYKQLQKKPYEVAAEKYPVGTVIKGKVERIFPYGAFVSIEDGIDGLVHVSQISHNWIKDANELLTVGQEVEAKIIGFEDTRITLSIKELLPAPEETVVDTEGEVTEEEKASKRSSRMKKFEQKVADGEGRKERRAPKKESSNEPKEWVSGSGSASFGDLIKGLNLELADEEVKEEAPKKTTRKKKTETVDAE